MKRTFTKYPIGYIRASYSSKYVSISSPDANPKIFDAAGSVTYVCPKLHISKISEDNYGVYVTVAIGNGLYVDLKYKEYSLAELSQGFYVRPSLDLLSDGGAIYHSRDTGRTAARFKDSRSEKNLKDFVDNAIIKGDY